MIQLHLIADRHSLSFSRDLIQYLQPYLGRISNMHLHEWEGDTQVYWTWEELFFAGKAYKDYIHYLGTDHEENYFVFLFYGINNMNWFASFNPDEGNVGFIQCSGWNLLDIYTPLYPVAYHLGALLAIMKFHGNNEDFSFYHTKSRGCMLDFTSNKEEVIYKLQSAHICKDCITEISQKSINRAASIEFLTALLSLFQSVKENLFTIDIQQYFGNLEYKLIVGNDASLFIKLEEDRKIELPLSNGWEKALYMTLLQYPKGLRFQDFKKEDVLRDYLVIYFRYFSGRDSMDSLYRQAETQIEGKTFQKNLYSIKNKVKKKINKALSAYPEISSALNIELKNDGRMIIPVDRNRIESHINAFRI
jgi:hypothetical protein